MSHRRIVTVVAFVLVAVAALAAPRTAVAKKHHRSDIDRFNDKLHHRETKAEHWGEQADEKATEAEEKHAQHEGKWEKMMDQIGRPQEQGPPPSQ